jgi:small subunit ribosomal protein S16
VIRIRLRRVGKKRQPYYRLVVADQKAKRDGAFMEILGSYDPHATPPVVRLDEAKTREWLGKGAQPSEAAEKILRRAGVLAAAGAPAAALKGTAAAVVEPEPAPATAPEPVAATDSEPSAEPETPAAVEPAEEPAEKPKRTRARKES